MATGDILLPRELKDYLGTRYATSLKCFHLNTRFARNKAADLELLFDTLDVSFDVVLFSETWYKHESDAFKLPEYNSHCLNRPSQRGGGVPMLIKESLSYELLTDYCRSTCDYKALSIRADQNVIAVFYRPPDGNISVFCDFLNDFFLVY